MDTETAAFVARLTADVAAISLLLSELAADLAKKTENPTAYIRQLADRMSETTSGPVGGIGPEAQQTSVWMRERLNLVLIGASDRLARNQR